MFLKDDCEEESEEVELRPKLNSPIWLSEIHDNKIFNRQKSLNNADERNETVTENMISEETPQRKGRPFPVRSISEIIEDEENIDEEDSPIKNDEMSDMAKT